MKIAAFGKLKDELRLNLALPRPEGSRSRQPRGFRAWESITQSVHSCVDDRIFRLVCLAVLLTLTSSVCTSAAQLLRGHVPEVVARLGLQAVGRLPATNRLSLVIGLPLRDTNTLNHLLQDLYDPASPQYRRYLTAQQFTERFGPTLEDYQSVVAFANSNGLQVTAIQPNRMFVDVSGKVADIEQALHITLRSYQHPNEARTFYAPDREPALDLAVPVLFIGGLNDLVLPRPLVKRMPPRDQLGKNSGIYVGSGPSGGYMGKDFRAAYAAGVSLDGSGQVLGLLEGDGYFASDIANYESQASLPNVPLTNVLVDGFIGSAFPSDNNNLEVALDIEMAASMAPGLAQIIVYEVDLEGIVEGGGNRSSALYDVLNRMATDDLARQLSSSWRINNDPLKTQIYQEFALQGQSFFQASGDNGAYNPNTFYTADNPYVTAVGGTTLFTSGPGGGWSSETVWNWWSTGQGAAASGGGISITNFPIPAYQQGINMTANGGSTTLRNAPDVAMTADNIYIVADNGQGEFVGGTSCAAPLWAAFAALVNQQSAQMGSNSVGFLNPALYAIAQGTNYAADFHDITTGNNTNPASPTLFYAQPGYDLCTGWGTPWGAHLINDLAPLDSLMIVPSSGFKAFGYAGGPFNVASQDFVLTNSGLASLAWAAGTTSAWLNVSTTAGTILPGGTAVTTVSANDSAARLAPGTYIGIVWFTNSSDGIVQTRQFTFQINDDLQITPVASSSWSRTFVSTFAPANQSFTLTNAGTGAVSWALGNTSPWFNVTPDSGAIASMASAQVTVDLTPTAAPLGVGSYTNTIWFTNLNDDLAQSRNVVITVWPRIVNGGFDTGDFTGWTVSPNNQWMIVSPFPYFTHSARYGAGIGASGSLAYLTQYVPTTPGGRYLLSLWLHSDGQTPNQFQVAWNGNILFNGFNLPAAPWTNLQFAVTATSASTLLQIGGRDDPGALALDDVSLVSTTPPAFTSITTTGALATFSWSTQPGLSYQVQYSTQSEPPDWTNLNAAITASNAALTLSDPTVPGPNAMRFYRVIQLMP